jgi:hypothetical protein
MLQYFPFNICYLISFFKYIIHIVLGRAWFFKPFGYGYSTRLYQKVPGQGKKRNAGLTYWILAAIFKIVSFGMYTSFFPHFKSTVEVISLDAVEYGLRFPLDVGHYFKTLSLQFNFQFGKQSDTKDKKLGPCQPSLVAYDTSSCASAFAWWGDFLNLPNPSSHTRPWGLLSL